MIKFIRSIVMFFLFALFGCGALFVRYCIFPFQKSKTENYETLQKSWQFFIKLCQKLKMIDLKIDNIEKIQSIKNSIIVSTHPSFLDIVILMSVIPYSTCFVADKLAKNPFFKGMVDLLFILDVKSVDLWLEKTCEMLQKGLNVIIFPMGIRHSKGEHPKIKRGTSLIALKSHKDIVMLNLETSYEFLQINQPIYKAGSEPVVYSLEFLGKIDTQDYLYKYDDEVTFKTAVTKQIAKTLYK